MSIDVTPLYASVLAIMMLVLSNIVSAHRARTKLSILHGTDLTLALWIRRHGNFVEIVPFALILMLLAELRGADPLYLHVVGALLVASRLAHAIGLRLDQPTHPLRLVGGIGSQLSVVCAIILLVSSQSGFF